MKSRYKIFIGLVFLAALLISIFVTVFYGAVIKPELEVNEKQGLELVPGTWTPELVKTYNDSDSIEMLEYSPFKGIVINGKCIAVKKLVIIAIPDWMESKGTFGTFIRMESWNDKNVLIGNSTKSYEKELPVAYIFTNINVSNTLYDRYIEYQHPAITIEMTEIIGIDLTETTACGIVTVNETHYRN